jgi:hypothetical protein
MGIRENRNALTIIAIVLLLSLSPNAMATAAPKQALLETPSV